MTIYEKTLVTGAAGFIGSHIVDKLVNDDVSVVSLDNLSTGKMSNLKNCENKKNHEFIKADLSDSEKIKKSLKDIKNVFHFAADPEVRTGYNDPTSTYRENLRNTFLLLEQIRKSNIERLIFASSSAVYGDAHILPTPENYSPLLPISHYGASKLACEAYVSSYCNNYGIKGYIIRPANVIGIRGRHGVTWDFIKKIEKNDKKLEVLGDGNQTKSYIHISDAVEGIFTSLKSTEKIGIFNLGSKDRVKVIKIAEIVRKNMNSLKTEIVTTGGIDGGRGWKGDIKQAHLDISKLEKLGWTPKLSSEESVDRASKEIIDSNKKS
jgi:UDP-glucose 4-epimerase